jgi:hypothetical protein
MLAAPTAPTLNRGVPKLARGVAGAMERIEYLGGALENPFRPF